MFVDFLDYPYSRIYELNSKYFVVCKNTNGLDTNSYNLIFLPILQFMYLLLLNKVRNCLTYVYCNEQVNHAITYPRIIKL